jgi:hypothetical protein
MSSVTDDRNTNGGWGGFPGGHPRLPRLSRATATPDEPDVMYVESAFLQDQGDQRPSDTPSSGFEAYYTRESLFESVPSSLLDEPDRDEGPYAVLGLTAAASWEEVSRSHRALVSQLHPDRYVDADDTVRAAAERRVRDVNEAFATIRRERSGRGR